jgi:rfaE bifunctional protein kinase chain/domain
MTAADINALFQRLSAAKIGVVGDFALDFYFTLQTQTGERSLETGHSVFWGNSPKSSLGAAGNVVQNLAALGVNSVQVVGCVGDDLFGREMRHLFTTLGVDIEHIHTYSGQWDTCLYAKPNLNGQEGNRIDFGTGNSLPDAVFTDIMDGLEQLLPALDVLVINQQFANPLLSENRVLLLNDLIARFPTVQFIADMRDVGKQIRGATLKVNTAELAKFLNIELPDHPDIDWCIQQGNTFRQQSEGPLLITRGQAGILYIDDQETQSVEGLSLPGELDTVGAGDTVVASWAACRGAGATPAQALEIANLAAAVTVQKVNQTGTATLPEILALHSAYLAHD